MLDIPIRTSLVAQAKAILRRQIEAGVWKGCLPSEVRLCGELQVSRITVRAALAELVAEKIVSDGRGRRRRILMQPKKARSAPPKRVILLTPVSMAAMARFELYWIDEVREHLTDAGFHLQVHKDVTCSSSKPGKVLEKLAQQLNPAGWVLLQCGRAAQQWFSRHGHAAVIAGSRHAGVNLPYVDLDYRALCRHAAGRFLARGHRRLAFVSINSGLAGDIESEQGFLEATQSAAPPAKVAVIRHDRSWEDVIRQMNALLNRPDAPTAYLVSKAYHALTVIGCLRQRGMRVPEDVSVISRDSESYLAHTVPPLTHYEASPELLARNISRVLIKMISSEMVFRRECRIMPQFVAGGTLSMAPSVIHS